MLRSTSGGTRTGAREGNPMKTIQIEHRYALERATSAEQAGRAIYLASTGRAPHFYASTERALEDIKACAAEQAEAAQ